MGRDVDTGAGTDDGGGDGKCSDDSNGGGVDKGGHSDHVE